jgi:hypothetical protein
MCRMRGLLAAILFALCSSNLLDYLQKESLALSNHHQSLRTFLNIKRIPIGLSTRVTAHKNVTHEITLSTTSNDVECRVSLGRAPIGSKCLAPCGCSGSQKWIQFNVLNRLRRKDPDQWKICRTCKNSFNYEAIYQYGGVKGNLLSLVLDRKQYLRVSEVCALLCCLMTMHFPKQLVRLLVSKSLWQQFPRWSRIVHLPFVFQIWGLRLGYQHLQIFLERLENLAVLYLSELETKIIEKNLPVTVP